MCKLTPAPSQELRGNLFTDADLLRELRDKKIKVSIGNSGEKYIIQHFWGDGEDKVSSVVCVCDESIVIFPYDEMVISIGEDLNA